MIFSQYAIDRWMTHILSIVRKNQSKLLRKLLLYDIFTVMNLHVPKEIHDKYPTYEFTGKPIKLRNGKTYMRAHHKTLQRTFFYCFEEDFFWFDKEDFMSVDGA